VRVLLVSHHTTRTGAPRIAVIVARTLVADGHDVQIIARHPGPLLGEFAQIAPTSVELLRRVRARLWRRHSATVARYVDTLLACGSILRRRPDLVYVNTTSAAVYVRAARWLRRRVLLHVHESGPVAAQFLDAARTRELGPAVTLVACSPSVRSELAALLGRPEHEVVLIPSVPDEQQVRLLAGESAGRDYPPDELVVGCVGAVERRKGADLWLDIAAQVLDGTSQRVRFVWVGDSAGADSLVAAAGPEIEFAGATPNPYAHVRHFDVATLPSRDDPFPLVVLEAMLLGRPVVAFGVGGVPQQVGEAGVLVAPGDTAQFARAVCELLEDPAERERLGSAARTRVQELYSAQAFAERIRRVVNS
jgi:glycosyltransferase involved in cell wall biosynthesis